MFGIALVQSARLCVFMPSMILFGSGEVIAGAVCVVVSAGIFAAAEFVIARTITAFVGTDEDSLTADCFGLNRKRRITPITPASSIRKERFIFLIKRQ